MAQIYRPSAKRPQQQVLRNQPVKALNHQGQGIVASAQGVRFVSGALAGELIDFRSEGKHQGKLLNIQQAAADRVIPACKYYDACGGCDLQHLALEQQREHKQQVVVELLAKFADVTAQSWLPLLGADAWRYRRRLRLACHWDRKRQRLTLGLRAAQSKQIVAIEDCLVAQEQITALLASLRATLAKLQSPEQLGHVELIHVDRTIVLLRLTASVSAADKALLEKFAERQHVDIWLHCAEQPPQPLLPQQQLPRYQSSQLMLEFQPGDFLQAHVNLSLTMVEQALTWLDPQAGESILELYAGSGNFTLPIALTGAQVTAIEGVPSMVERLRATAQQQKLRVTAVHADLEQNWRHYPWAQQRFDKVLLDPARAGAPHAITEIAQRQPRRVIYVSCAPDTLARDAKQLRAAGYQLKQAQIIDMFPQTHHIECLTWFEREA
ncbi:methyltransferase domain-containing protein [Pseudidiomarina salilacus]|uniref:methyltransferase domain-containing protein n=1 Tax=Pseudidiomarina salilacus TaxID=3384452 RepID=UPI0039846E5A